MIVFLALLFSSIFLVETVQSQYDTVIDYTSGGNASCGEKDSTCQINCNNDGNCHNIDINCPQSNDACELCEINCYDCQNVNINAQNCSNVEIHSLATNGLITSNIYVPIQNGNVTIDAINVYKSGNTWIDTIEIIDSSKGNNNNNVDVNITCYGASCINNGIDASNLKSLTMSCSYFCSFQNNFVYCPNNNYNDGVSCNIFYGWNGIAENNYYFAEEGFPADIYMYWDDPIETYSGGGESGYYAYDYVFCQEGWTDQCSLGQTDTSCYQCTIPTASPSSSPTNRPSILPTMEPSNKPSYVPTSIPTVIPTTFPSNRPSMEPSTNPTNIPSLLPSLIEQSNVPTSMPSIASGPSTKQPMITNTSFIDPVNHLFNNVTNKSTLTANVESTILAQHDSNTIALDTSTDPTGNEKESSTTNGGLSMETLMLGIILGASFIIFVIIIIICIWGIKRKTKNKSIATKENTKNGDDGITDHVTNGTSPGSAAELANVGQPPLNTVLSISSFEHTPIGSSDNIVQMNSSDTLGISMKNKNINVNIEYVKHNVATTKDGSDHENSNDESEELYSDHTNNSGNVTPQTPGNDEPQKLDNAFNNISNQTHSSLLGEGQIPEHLLLNDSNSNKRKRKKHKKKNKRMKNANIQEGGQSVTVNANNANNEPEGKHSGTIETGMEKYGHHNSDGSNLFVTDRNDDDLYDVANVMAKNESTKYKF